MAMTAPRPMDLDSIPSIPPVYNPGQAEAVLATVRRNVVQSMPANSSKDLSPGLPRPAYRFKPTVTVSVQEGVGDTYGKRLRKSLQQVRRTVDYISSVLNYTEARIWQKNQRERPFVQPDLLYSAELYPASYERGHVIDCVTNKLVRSAMNKIKCPIYTICWTPEGRRLLTGASSGEFTLWNGIAFNFETILQAHDCAVRSMVWSHNDQWMITADHDGFVKYWQSNMNNVKMYQAHKEAVRSISFCPMDSKFATASDDGTVRVWDFTKCHEELILRGHGSDVRSVDWHPQKSLLASGSRDSQLPLKLWDPKNGSCLATLHDHKNGVMDVKWNRNGNWLASASRDHLVKVYDVRMMREIQTFRGHKKEVISLAWHPVHEPLFVSGGSDGAIVFWNVGTEKEVGLMENAHEQTIWTLAWHPLGHILASGSNDNNTKFWARNKPGDVIDDFYGMGPGQYEQESTAAEQLYPARERDTSGNVAIPGMGLDREVLDNVITGSMAHGRHGDMYGSADSDGIPGLGGLEDRPPGLPAPASHDRGERDFRFPGLIKKPTVKQAQREFEKIWNVAGSTVLDDGMGRGMAPGSNSFGPRPDPIAPPPHRPAITGPPDVESSGIPGIGGGDEYPRMGNRGPPPPPPPPLNNDGPSGIPGFDGPRDLPSGPSHGPIPPVPPGGDFGPVPFGSEPSGHNGPGYPLGPGPDYNGPAGPFGGPQNGQTGNFGPNQQFDGGPGRPPFGPGNDFGPPEPKPFGQRGGDFRGRGFDGNFGPRGRGFDRGFGQRGGDFSRGGGGFRRDDRDYQPPRRDGPFGGGDMPPPPPPPDNRAWRDDGSGGDGNGPIPLFGSSGPGAGPSFDDRGPARGNFSGRGRPFEDRGGFRGGGQFNDRKRGWDNSQESFDDRGPARPRGRGFGRGRGRR